MPSRDDIDVVRSAQMLFRARLPNIINLVISRSPNALRMLIDQCRITARQFCALIVRANSRGQEGIVEILDQTVVSFKCIGKRGFTFVVRLCFSHVIWMAFRAKCSSGLSCPAEQSF